MDVSWRWARGTWACELADFEKLVLDIDDTGAHHYETKQVDDPSDHKKIY